MYKFLARKDSEARGWSERKEIIINHPGLPSQACNRRISVNTGIEEAARDPLGTEDFHGA